MGTHYGCTVTHPEVDDTRSVPVESLSPTGVKKRSSRWNFLWCINAHELQRRLVHYVLGVKNVQYQNLFITYRIIHFPLGCRVRDALVQSNRGYGQQTATACTLCICRSQAFGLPVYAEALPCWGRSVVKNMTQVRITDRTQDFCSRHEGDRKI